MRARHARLAFGVASIIVVSHRASAQVPRTRTPLPDAPASNGVPRDSRFPYAGMWSGIRTMPVGADQISFVFTVGEDHYSGVTFHPGGGRAPQVNLTETAAGLSWEQPN